MEDIRSQLRVPMEGHRGTERQSITKPESCSKNTVFQKPFLPFLPILTFSNNSYNFSNFQLALAAVSQLVVSSDDILAGLWNLHSEALADILDMTIDYDILELPPPSIAEPRNR